MSISGSPSAWIDLLEGILPDLLQSVIDTWDVFRGPLKNAREDTVTDALCLALRQNRKLRGLPVYVIPQLVELEPEEGEGVGRLDIAFLPTSLPGPPDESIYFCLECKWLNVVSNRKRYPKGSEYVKQGMLRFVTGKYAKAVRHGGMVGYVLDGDVASAITNVENNVRRNHVILCMEAPGVLHPSSIMDHMPIARETLHNRKDEKRPFRIHHLFVAADKLLFE